MLASQRSGRHNARCSNTDELLITNEFRLRSLAAAPENTGARAAVGRRGRRRMISEGATNAHRGAPASELLNVLRSVARSKKKELLFEVATPPFPPTAGGLRGRRSRGAAGVRRDARRCRGSYCGLNGRPTAIPARAWARGPQNTSSPRAEVCRRGLGFSRWEGRRAQIGPRPRWNAGHR